MKNMLTVSDLSKMVHEMSKLKLASVPDKEAAHSTTMAIMEHIDNQIKESMELLRKVPETLPENVIKVDFINRKRV